MRLQPTPFAPQDTSMFGEASVVPAAQYRPPYAPDTFALVLQLIAATAPARTVLDAGCGPGVIARGAVREVDHDPGAG